MGELEVQVFNFDGFGRNEIAPQSSRNCDDELPTSPFRGSPYDIEHLPHPRDSALRRELDAAHRARTFAANVGRIPPGAVFVDNVNGSDTFDGMRPDRAKRTVAAAAEVLRANLAWALYIVPTGVPFSGTEGTFDPAPLTRPRAGDSTR